MLEYWKTEAVTEWQMLLEFDRLVPPSLWVQRPSWAWMIRWKKRGTIIEGLGVTVADVRFRPVGCPKHASMQHVEAGSRLKHKVDRDAVEQCTRMEPVREATWTHSETPTGSGSDKHNVSDGNATGVMGGCEINTR